MAISTRSGLGWKIARNGTRGASIGSGVSCALGVPDDGF